MGFFPPYKTPTKESCGHLYLLRIDGAEESQRDEIIQLVSEQGVGVNVHYIPMAMLTLFKERGYKMADYPTTYRLYANEISLPIYNGLDDEKVDYVISAVEEAVEAVMSR